jgi:hypothetical protein
MRAGAAIIAAVLSVFTGGPHRCPCRFAAVLVSYSQTAPSLPTAASEDGTGGSGELSCSCKSHPEPARPDVPTKRKPTPGVPCGHCPAVDLVLPSGSGERAVGDREPGDVSAASFGDSAAAPLAHRPDPLALVPLERTSSAPDRLRYCHSFRC